MLGGYRAATQLAPGQLPAVLTAAVIADIKAKLGGATNLVFSTHATQVVAGTNHKFTGNADNTPFEAVVFEALPHTGAAPSVTSADLTGPSSMQMPEPPA